MQVTIVTSLSEEYCHCYKLYQDYCTTDIFFPALYMLQNVLIVLLLCHVIQFCLYFTLAKDGVKCNCIYDMFVPVIVLQKKKKKNHKQVWVKIKSYATIALLSIFSLGKWREILTLKSQKCAF